MSKYKIGNMVTGCVTGIEKYGIFVNLDDYYSGLIHISEMSDNFVKNPNDFVEIGEIINAKVISVDDDLCHLKLSIKNVKYKTTKPTSSKIQEVGSGFEMLANNLNEWIEKSKNDLLNKNN